MRAYELRQVTTFSGILLANLWGSLVDLSSEPMAGNERRAPALNPQYGCVAGIAETRENSLDSDSVESVLKVLG